jgi:hypothetical protein
MKKLFALAVLGALLSAGAAEAYVPVLSGGVGENSRSAIDQLQKDFTLKVIFTGDQGIYLSDVNVQILDANRNVVVSNVTQGPILLAGLPAGHYTMQANIAGHVQRQTFTVGDRGLKTLYMRFPVQDDAERPSL